MDISDVRQVSLYYIGGAPTSYLIPIGEVDRFVEASKRLHWRPGKNPHNGADAAKIWKITVSSLELRGPFWWTVPDLQKNGDPAGARFIEGGSGKVVFVDDEYVARQNAEQAEAEARFYREQEAEARKALA